MMAAPSNSPKQKRRSTNKRAARRRQVEERLDYKFRVTGWDYYYSLRPGDPKVAWEKGAYSMSTFSSALAACLSSRRNSIWARRASCVTKAYEQAASAVWVLTEERTCRTSSLDLTTGACAAGTTDLVTTAYDYGPTSGPNNLWLRGVAVTADGQTLRTCYGYGSLGRRISETQPNANLTSCP